MIGAFFVKRTGSYDYVANVNTGTGIAYAAEVSGGNVLQGIELDFIRIRKEITVGVNSIGLSATAVIVSATAPTTRIDGTALKSGDEWIESDNNNKLYIWSGSAWIDRTDWSAQPTYTNGTTFPATPKTGDWHFYTGAEGAYHANTWYRYSGTVWDNKGLAGTYIDATGVYTGTVAANQIIAGTGIINALSVLSILTIGSAATDGYIQSYGWNGTANGFQIKGGASPTINLIGGTITSAVFQNSTDANTKIRIDTNGMQLGGLNVTTSYVAPPTSLGTTIFDVGWTTSVNSKIFKIVGGTLDLVLMQIEVQQNDLVFAPRFPQGIYVGAWTITEGEIAALTGITGTIQTQINGKGSLVGANTWTAKNTFNNTIVANASSLVGSPDQNVDVTGKNSLTLEQADAINYTLTLINPTADQIIFITNVSTLSGCTYTINPGNISMGIGTMKTIKYNSAKAKWYSN